MKKRKEEQGILHQSRECGSRPLVWEDEEQPKS
jgi:hypothetical protein